MKGRMEGREGEMEKSSAPGLQSSAKIHARLTLLHNSRLNIQHPRQISLTKRLVLSRRVDISLTSLLDDFAEFERDGRRRGDFVLPVEFGDLGVVRTGGGFVARGCERRGVNIPALHGSVAPAHTSGIRPESQGTECKRTLPIRIHRTPSPSRSIHRALRARNSRCASLLADDDLFAGGRGRVSSGNLGGEGSC